MSTDDILTERLHRQEQADARAAAGRLASFTCRRCGAPGEFYEVWQMCEDCVRMVYAGRLLDGATAEQACEALLVAIGEDPKREGLRGTPARMARMLRELCAPQPFEFTTFDGEGMDEMVIQSGISFGSLCEHHVLPFVGTATVAYIPGERIVGLSKLARAVRFCAAGLQNQERITRNVADLLLRSLKPAGVAVVLRARHLCMELRGVKAAEAWSTTSCLLGAFKEDGRARSEFLRLSQPQP